MILAATQIYGSHGGIPSYMRRLSEIGSAVSKRSGRPFTAVSLMDQAADFERHVQPVEYSAFHGARGSRGRFIKDLFRTALQRRGQTLIAGHVALAPLGLALLRLKLIRSYVVVLHGIEAWRRVRAKERMACLSATAIAATTRYTQELFAEKNGWDARRISVGPLAIDRAALDLPSSDDAPAQDPLRVLFVGRLCARERYKGADELIEAVSLLRSEQVRVALTFIGGGDDLSRLEAKVKSLGLAACVAFRGAVGNDDLAAAYRGCDLFAMPSSGEGFGIAFLEAMSYGKPCLGARCGGIPEVVDDGTDGFLVSPGSVDEIAVCLRKCAADRKLLRAMGGLAFEKVSKKYLLGTMLSNWQRLLERGAGA
jgi:phosphatidyl-myo-inositol dimannoside synthase